MILKPKREIIRPVAKPLVYPRRRLFPTPYITSPQEHHSRAARDGRLVDRRQDVWGEYRRQWRRQCYREFNRRRR